MAQKSISPSVHESAFDCPHCGAYTTQYWYKSAAKHNDDNHPPRMPSEEFEGNIKSEKDLSEAMRNKLLGWINQMRSGLVFFEKTDGRYFHYDVENLNLSKCYSCGKIAVWIHDRVLFPPARAGAQPNPDLSEDIIKDFEEARSILDLSPRGAAALLRLSIQKLCITLGEKGKNIDDDIASLVTKGLNPLIQQSLDIVRVIGNEAVHPGVIDLNDDRDTAEQLFNLINVIAEQMISIPNSVGAMYESLPESKRAAIEVRNKKAIAKNTE